MMKIVLLIVAALGTVFAQSAVDLMAEATLGDSTSVGAASGTGEVVTGDVDVSITQTSSSSSAVVTASGPATAPIPSPTLTPVPTPTPAPMTTTKQYMAPQPQKSVKPVIYMKKDKEVKPVCKDVVNATCGDIEKYDHCGFCILNKYPTHGVGCTYTKQLVKKDGKKGETEIVLAPECECKGDFILEAEKCPTCQHALDELVKCAKAKADEVIEIPAKCIEKVGVSVEYLKDCGYIKAEKDPKPAAKKYAEHKKEKSPQMVVVKKETPAAPVPVHVVPVHQSVAPVVSLPTASASAQAVASGPGANATAFSSASVGN
eukprot:TRINITY_DN47_c0_g1_i7.p1 TRINITY_DN47_c0_g1~~TRINITY_DN47_c0_g1_i7.p1  ORF type:complete len:317 (-),score=101.18 TRINITY_DN47_c0_g1_i7:99-1049(-)